MRRASVSIKKQGRRNRESNGVSVVQSPRRYVLLYQRIEIMQESLLIPFRKALYLEGYWGHFSMLDKADWRCHISCHGQTPSQPVPRRRLSRYLPRNEKQNIYRDDADRSRFLQQLNQSVNIYTVKLHSYVLMTNHFHLLVETQLGNLSEFMRHLNIAYIGYFNRRHKRVGHLYQGRYKAILVDKDAYLSVLSRYNPSEPCSDQGSVYEYYSCMLI